MLLFITHFIQAPSVSLEVSFEDVQYGCSAEPSMNATEGYTAVPIRTMRLVINDTIKWAEPSMTALENLVRYTTVPIPMTSSVSNDTTRRAEPSTNAEKLVVYSAASVPRTTCVARPSPTSRIEPVANDTNRWGEPSMNAIESVVIYSAVPVPRTTGNIPTTTTVANDTISWAEPSKNALENAAAYTAVPVPRTTCMATSSPTLRGKVLVPGVYGANKWAEPSTNGTEDLEYDVVVPMPTTTCMTTPSPNATRCAVPFLHGIEYTAVPIPTPRVEVPGPSFWDLFRLDHPVVITTFELLLAGPIAWLLVDCYGTCSKNEAELQMMGRV